jgi:hypothetical protein
MGKHSAIWYPLIAVGLLIGTITGLADEAAAPTPQPDATPTAAAPEPPASEPTAENTPTETPTAAPMPTATTTILPEAESTESTLPPSPTPDTTIGTATFSLTAAPTSAPLALPETALHWSFDDGLPASLRPEGWLFVQHESGGAAQPAAGSTVLELPGVNGAGALTTRWMLASGTIQYRLANLLLSVDTTSLTVVVGDSLPGSALSYEVAPGTWFDLMLVWPETEDVISIYINQEGFGSFGVLSPIGQPHISFSDGIMTRLDDIRLHGMLAAVSVSSDVTATPIVVPPPSTLTPSPTPVTAISAVPPAPPSLLLPNTGVVVEAVRPTFSWSAVAGANAYRLEIATDPSFDPGTIHTSVVTAYTAALPTTPLAQGGTYYWRVFARNAANEWSGASATRDFRLNIQKLPANNAVSYNQRPAFTWSAATGATSVIVEFSLFPDFSSPSSATLSGASTAFIPPAALPFGQYYWRVNVVRNSTTEEQPIAWARTLTSSPLPPPAPLLTAPPSSATLGTSQPLLMWTPPNYPASVVTYDVQVSKMSTFATLDRTAAGLNATQFTVDPALADGLYYWRVRAVNAWGVGGAFSAARVFVVDTVPPQAPVLSLPANAGTVDLVRPVLSWLRVADATAYEIQLALDSSFNEPLIMSGTTTATAYTVPAPLAQGGTFHWRVRAQDKAGNWGASAARSFNVNVQIAPLANAVSFTQRPTFTWRGVPGAASIFVELSTDATFTDADQILRYTLPGTAVSLVPPVGVPHGNYFWRINVLRGAQQEVQPAQWARPLTISPAAPVAPVQTAPPNAIHTGDNTPELAWNAPPYTHSSVTYDVQVATSATFAAPVRTASTPSTALVIDPILPDGLYYWRVRALNAWGVAGAFSPARTLLVDTAAPPPPLLQTPANAATIDVLKPTLVWQRIADAVEYTVEIAEDPAFTIPVILPNNKTAFNSLALPVTLAHGREYFWRTASRDRAGNWSTFSTPFSFRINLQTSPASNAITFSQRPGFYWKPAVGASQIELQLSAEPAFAAPTVITLPGTAASYVPPALMPFGHYYWRVVVIRGALREEPPPAWARKLTISPAAPGVPVLLAPANAIVINTATPLFSWNAPVYTASSMTHTVQIASNATFTLNLQEFSGLSDTQFSPATSLPDGVYYWRVRAVNSWDVGGAFSPARLLTVDTTAPQMPVLQLPADLATIAATTVPLRWLPVSGAVRYTVQWSALADFAVLNSAVVTTTTHTPAMTLPAGLYFWRVQAVDQAGNASPFSAPFRVTLSTLAGSAPMPNAMPATSVLLQWSPLSWAQGYHVQVSNSVYFVSIVYEAVNLPADSWEHAVAQPLPQGIYYYRVRASKTATSFSGWSTAMPIVIYNPP